MWCTSLGEKERGIVQIKHTLVFKKKKKKPIAIHRGYRNVLICKLVIKIWKLRDSHCLWLLDVWTYLSLQEKRKHLFSALELFLELSCNCAYSLKECWSRGGTLACHLRSPNVNECLLKESVAIHLIIHHWSVKVKKMHPPWYCISYLCNVMKVQSYTRIWFSGTHTKLFNTLAKCQQ